MTVWRNLRLLTRLVLCLLILVAIPCLFYQRSQSRSYDLWTSAIQWQIQRGTLLDLKSDPWFQERDNQAKSQLTFDDHLNSPYGHDTIASKNHYIDDILKCPFRLNQHTDHIRLPYTPFYNISLLPADQESDSELHYFNPTFIPLPSWSPHPYLLVSRLVTTGFYQESHVCLADLCLPKSLPYASTSRSTEQEQILSRLPVDAKPCTESDVSILSTSGGLRCATPPQRLNVPPTPALRCEGSWSAFPDIPGFHDPRVFWSGKGEPLAIFNSGSQYGCIGLWVVDLRAVYPTLASILERGIVARKMSYPYPTEIMRARRGAIEKNWVMFFPKGEEAWIQFDMIDHGENSKHDDATDLDDHVQKVESTVPSPLAEGMDSPEATINNNDSLARNNRYHTINTLTSGFRSRSNVSSNASSFLDHAVSALNDETAISILDESVYQQKTVDTSNMTTDEGNSSAGFSLVIRQTRPNKLLENSQAPTAATSEDVFISPSRSLAQLFGSGYTTSNLTSPSESSCFNSSHVYDSLGNRGHWHQGSNSLRLVLCHRPGYHQRTSTQPESGEGDECSLTDENEDQLVRDGRVVHFMIMHRKFTNNMKLPLRYERYFLIWEARQPFMVVSISAYPILFSEEAARPWGVDQNWPDEDEDGDADVSNATKTKEGRRKWRDVYFTYTPSIAWTWRRSSDEDDAWERRLGTGHLEDEVLVGVGMDDTAQVFVRVSVKSLLSCQRLCPEFRDDDH